PGPTAGREVRMSCLRVSLLCCLVVLPLQAAPRPLPGPGRLKLPLALKGHPRTVWAVAFHPSGKVLASGGGEGTIKLWDLTTGKSTAPWAAHTEHRAGAVALSFSPDGKVLASAGYEGVVLLWDVASGKRRAALAGHSLLVHSVRFSPDGKLLA